MDTFHITDGAQLDKSIYMYDAVVTAVQGNLQIKQPDPMRFAHVSSMLASICLARQQAPASCRKRTSLPACRLWAGSGLASQDGG